MTDYEFPYNHPLDQTCLNCGKCIKNCPSGAITEHGIDYSNCLSGITQKKGELTEYEQTLVQKNGLMWGCDCCQNCCPYNQNLSQTYIQGFLDDVEPVITRENLNRLCKNRAFGYKGKTLLKRNLDLITQQENSPSEE